MNLANSITLSRLVLALILPFFLTCSIPFGQSIGLLIFLLAALTDYWDGRLARKISGITPFGQLMDPLADKVLIGAAFICFVAQNQIVPAWIVVIIITREFLITGLRLLGANQGRILAAGRWGKHKTIWQLGVIAIIIFGEALRKEILPQLLHKEALDNFLQIYYNPWMNALTTVIIAIVALLTIASGLIYFWRYKGWVMQDA